MDEAFYTPNPLAIVQLIPVINYLNILSDFLLIENYLAEVDQSKQIPIVNALYGYFDENRYNNSMQMKLIRNLLKGSDLYGAQDNEELNTVFVNTMFDYIISSLVFDKYGNIYGFLAEVIRRTENLQIDYVLMMVKETLKNATFENEYGDNSVLTNLAVDRIYNDIILPLFPQPDTNLSLLSLDYIFAQAGSMYLRLGKINDTYFLGNENKTLRNVTKNNRFNEYLTIGHVIRKLIHCEKIDFFNMRVFALPALFYYVSTENRVKNENIMNVIFSPDHWKTAYHDLFKRLDTIFERIESQLMKHYTYKIHLAYLHFQNLAVMANSILNLECKFLNQNNRESGITIYIEHAKHFKCPSELVVPHINDWFEDQVYNIGEIYGKYDLAITQQPLNKFSMEDLRGVEITLLFFKERVLHDDFKSSQYLSYDLFEFHNTKTNIYDYYALIRENYTVKLIKESEDPELFQTKVNISVNELIESGHRIILKNADEGEIEFNKKLMKHEKERSMSYFYYSDDSLKKNEWWKEFGLSLVPSYPCLLKITNHDDIKNNLCKINNIQFVNQFQDDMTHNYTQSLLSSLGTTIKSISLKDSISALVDAHDTYTLMPQIISKPMDTVYDTLSLHIEEPAFVYISTTQNDVRLVTTIVDELEENINSNFTSVKDVLNQMQILKTSYMKPLHNNDEKRNRHLFVSVGKNYTGYGYKFFIIRISNGTIEFAQLRTGYEFKDEILIMPIQNSSNHVKTYIKLNNTTFDIEADYIYEIDNQLRKKSTRMLFFGIIVQNENNNNTNIENCGNEYLENTGYSDVCLRHWRFDSKKCQKEEAVQFFKNKASLFGKYFISDEQIRNTLKQYIFPDANESLTYFVDSWLKDEKFENSDWSRKYTVENPELLNKLRYDVHLGNCNLSLSDGESGIDSIYMYRERRKIEDGTSLGNIIQDYNEQKACYSVTFEDYYAIRNFATTGDQRITGDTIEAKLMKIALYKLAIRQFEIFDEKFETKLYRIETKPSDFVITELYKGKRIVLQKFLSTSTSVGSELRFSAYPASGFRNVLYEFNLVDPYFRAEIGMTIDKFDVVREKKVILLPGSEFKISKISIVSIGGIGNVLKVVLSSLYGSYGKYEWYKNIMAEITRIKY